MCKNATGGGKFKICLFAIMAGCLFYRSDAAVASVTKWAEDTIAVDAAAPFRTVAGSITLNYNAAWCTGAEGDGATVVIKAVANPDTANSVTSVVQLAEGADTVSGSVEYAGTGYMRFILGAELDGVGVGDQFVFDASFGAMSAFSDATAFDGRTNALQEVINARAATSLRYDLLWADVASDAEISLVRVRRNKSGDILEVTTNSLHSADAPIAGEVDFSTANFQWGEYKLLLQEYAGDGSPILEWLSPEFSIAHVFGTCVVIR
jgi:hypothetical protein